MPENVYFDTERNSNKTLNNELIKLNTINDDDQSFEIKRKVASRGHVQKILVMNTALNYSEVIAWIEKKGIELYGTKTGSVIRLTNSSPRPVPSTTPTCG